MWSNLLQLSPPRSECGHWAYGLDLWSMGAEVAMGFSYIGVAVAIHLHWNNIKRYGVIASTSQRPMWMFPFLFKTVFLGCGISHLLDAVSFSYAAYNAFAVIKVPVAIVSLAAAPAFFWFHNSVLFDFTQAIQKLRCERDSAQQELRTMQGLDGSDLIDAADKQQPT